MHAAPLREEEMAGLSHREDRCQSSDGCGQMEGLCVRPWRLRGQENDRWILKEVGLEHMCTAG